ncbi:phosphatidate cytidylyltransferase [Pleomorphomonas diazotrophica]|uniref:Phosphatidate cytidylyltransferase n=1 Tax=Pleomorphomonas diazotrophica TaxID=1166257 RepID=A0A1I4TS61_9HYPH|nr:phosphatidate cytidylyltransferase [Pleomorphomonas diazotrophica]PKR87634.1 phosphatidate cytidylyltransferase [Pleomorphomonas diazotrophica]SFM79415.1 phosphatidate cytidylyltransferase [Pleomorphomonas diazotrophica]
MTPPSAGKPGSELVLRLLSAVVLAAVTVAALWAGGWVFAALAAVAAVLILREWMAMSGPFSFRAAPWALMAFVAVTAMTARDEPLQSLGFTVLVAAALLLARVTEPRVAWLSTGVLYAGLPAIAAVALRGADMFTFASTGAVAVIFILAIVWATDTAAYFFGRLIGGPKLAPRFSPKKTWSGALGGAASGVIVGCLVAVAAGIEVSLPLMLIALLLSIVGQVGDLVESAMKRHFGVKDSGVLIPGHGGIMDRVDGLVAALALAMAIGFGRDWLSGGGVAAGLLVW